MGALSGLSKQQVSDKLAADTQAFLDAGGEVEQLPYDDTAEQAAGVGCWVPMGGDGEMRDDLFGDILLDESLTAGATPAERDALRDMAQDNLTTSVLRDIMDTPLREGDD